MTSFYTSSWLKFIVAKSIHNQVNVKKFILIDSNYQLTLNHQTGAKPLPKPMMTFYPDIHMYHQATKG